MDNLNVDFFCPSDTLLIDFDSDPQSEKHKILEDEYRDKYLESFGFTILRF